MDFHGSEILAGDKVYDVAFSWGTVLGVDSKNKKIIVMFGNRRVVYDEEGKCGLFNAATLYWANPLHSIRPDKDQKYWPIFINTANALAKELNKVNNV